MRRGQRGFTMIELVMSIALIALFLLSSYYALLQAHYLSIESRSRLMALNAARSALETIKATPLGSVTSISTAGFIPQDLTSGTMTIATNPSNLTGVTVATVTVTVNWRTAKNALRQLEISTMRSIY